MLVTDRTVEAAIRRVDATPELWTDTETDGLEVFTQHRMVGTAVGAGGEDLYFPFRHREGANLNDAARVGLMRAMARKKLKGFHLRFDVEVLQNEGLPPPPAIEDTMIAAVLMNENEQSFALKRSKAGLPGLSMKYLGAESVSDDEALRAKLEARGFAKQDLWKLPAEDVADYATADLALPRRLMAEVYEPGLATWKLTDLFQEYNDYQRLLISMETGGLPLDTAVVQQALADGETARADLLAQLHRAAGYPLNPNSPKQVKAWLGTPDAQEETLMRCGNPHAELIVDLKAYTKRDSTYLQRFLDYSHNGILHTNLNLTPNDHGEGGTRSARLSGSHPNLQAMPKPKTNIIYAPCRQAIIAPEGYCLMEADYSQAEVRIAAHYSQEPALIAVFRGGIDIYEEFAAEVRSLVRGFDRQAAKILHLAIQYGAGVWKIALMLGVTEAVAKALRDRWHKRFPRISHVMRSMQKKAEEHGVIRLWTGRWGHFDGPTKSQSCKSPYYTAWNRLIQGTVAEIIRHAMMRLWEPLNAIGARMLLQVHDSILLLVPLGRRAEAARIVRQNMEAFPGWTVPMTVDIKTGPNWLDVKEWKEAA